MGRFIVRETEHREISGAFETRDEAETWLDTVQPHYAQSCAVFDADRVGDLTMGEVVRDQRIAELEAEVAHISDLHAAAHAASVRNAAARDTALRTAAGSSAEQLGHSSWLSEMRERLRTQDNRITAHPVFVVQQRHRTYGFDPAYVQVNDEIAWIDGPNDNATYHMGDPEWEEAEERWQKYCDEPDGLTRTGWHDSWEFVTACFTEQGCKDYIHANGHNLTDPRIYVESAHRNQEWQQLRAILLEPAEDKA
ncbi:MAG: hypothetical protein JRD89_03560 [Deltaproteobacteria bacterium]|nr:hypothetical protein [Deltaproteobacteria bacterium]